MSQADQAPPPSPRVDGHVALRWPALLVLSAVLVILLEAMHLSAALLIGPMVAAIALAAAGRAPRIPNVPFLAAQGVVGCMIARSLTPSIAVEMARGWPLFLAAVASVITASAALGWLLTRWRVLPGSTAIWGSFPGAAATMSLMAEAFGADIRLVAFMQYLRVLLVALAASGVARLGGGDTVAHATTWFTPVTPGPFAPTLALAFGAAALAPRLRIPAGPLLLPMVLSAVLQGFGWLTITLPPWLLAASYALVGWSIGQRFTPTILRHALKALPQVVGAIAALILVCGLLALGLMRLAHVSALTAYLAMSPGGADSVAIIAASSKVDVPLVMALQSARFVTVLLVGPALARLLARRVPGEADAPA
ncbi:AbrB family transcriptional regulator [Frateuria defendens]|uniref:AbrB family transcriptional regulator n=1 Tax=Frateuria defendens TaxID=2219559 RepID=UPI00066FEA5B|nr:AbrB family transcriptional regulator [Frateuria defendens]